MPAPVIDPTTSILDYLQHQYWTFRPFAANTPTSWTIDPMAPDGMTFDPTTGAISGAATVAGVYVFAIRAHNADGASAPLVIAAGIEAAASDPRSLAVDMRIDLTTRSVELATGVMGGEFLHAVKRRDDLIYNVSFTKNGVVAAVPLDKLSWSLKRTPDGEVLAASDDWKQLTAGQSPTYAVHANLGGSGLAGELEDTDERKFIGYAEFEWLQTNPAPGIGPNPLRGSSQSFRVLVVDDHMQA
jgi:hypothetical protein